MHYLIDEKIRLLKLNKELYQTRKSYDKQIREAEKAKKPREEIESIIGEMYGVCNFTEEEIDLIKSRQLRRRASKYNIPLPDMSDDDFWRRIYNHEYKLTEKGMYETTKLIRQEKRERREAFIQYVTVLMGLIGIVIGLISVIKSG